MISVVNVDVSDDLKNAKIYLSFYNNKEDFDPSEYFKELNKYKNNIKFKLGNSLKIKYVPKIQFLLSDEYEYYDKIDRLLKKSK